MTSPKPGYYQNENRDLRGDAMVGAVVDVFDVGTTTPATIYSTVGRTAMVASPLPAAAGLNRPGIDVAANIAFFAEDEDGSGNPLEYDIRVTFRGQSFVYRARPAPAPVGGGFIKTTGANPTLSHAAALRWSAGGSGQVAVRVSGDSGAVGDGVWNLAHNGDSGFIAHFGVTGSGGAAIGIGVGGVGGPTGGSGILIDNYSTGLGILFQNLDSITDAEAYGIYGVQDSELAPLIRLEASRPDAAPVLQLVGAGSATGRILEVLFGGGSDTAGYVKASDGTLLWRSRILAESGDPQVRINATGSLNEVVFTAAGVVGMTNYGYSGSPGFWYATGVRHTGDELHLQAAVQVAAKGSETMLDAIVVKGGAFTSNVKMGFYGATPIVKPTAVAVTAAGVHAALVSLGLIAA